MHCKYFYIILCNLPSLSVSNYIWWKFEHLKFLDSRFSKNFMKRMYDAITASAYEPNFSNFFVMIQIYPKLNREFSLSVYHMLLWIYHTKSAKKAKMCPFWRQIYPTLLKLSIVGFIKIPKCGSNLRHYIVIVNLVCDCIYLQYWEIKLFGNFWRCSIYTVKRYVNENELFFKIENRCLWVSWNLVLKINRALGSQKCKEHF